MATVQDLPIDIHSGKLLDWLISRRHCQKDWQKNVLAIREKIKHAMLDMPESNEVVQLLQGSYLNYFHCLRIIEILQETEKSTKNFLGYYSSQRMKDWQEIVSLYKKNNVYIAEAAQILQRLIQYEIPGLKKQITKAEQVLTDSARKEKDYYKQADEGRKLYQKELQRMGIQGNALRSELLALAADLPSFFAKVTNDVILHIKKPHEYYINFRNYIHQNKKISTKTLPLLSLLFEKGPELTAFEFKYGIPPTSIEPPSFHLLLEEDKKTSEDDDIDFGDDVIDFGSDTIEDSEAEVLIDVVADTSGAIGESVARGEDALSVVENPYTQEQIKGELNELLNFLNMRKEDEERDTAADVFIRGFEKRPSEISKVPPSQLGDWINKISSILDQLSDEQKKHLFRIRSSPQFVEKIVSEIEAKKAVEGRYRGMAALMVQKQKEAQEQIAKTGQELQLIVTSTKQLQKQLEEEISKKYDGRRVNIMGGITAVLSSGN